MKTGRKTLLILLGLSLVLAVGAALLTEYLHPTPELVFARMERRDLERAREILDDCADGLQALAAAAAGISPDDSYSYGLNSGAAWDREALRDMPEELAAALERLEADFPDLALSLLLRQGQVGVSLTSDGRGFSYLCYPRGDLVSRSVLGDEEGIRCVDMGGGWEVQMYYAPRG